MRVTSIRIDDHKLNQLDALAETMGKSRGQVFNEALDRYLEYHEWFLAQVDTGLSDVEEGRVVSGGAVAEALKKWGVDGD